MHRDIALLEASKVDIPMLDSLEEAILLVEESHKKNELLDFNQVAEFISGQQIRSGNDAGIFVESRNVSRRKGRVYTGEKLQTYLAGKKILTISATRALVISKSASKYVQPSIDLAMNWLEDQCVSNFCATGECRHSTIAFMRLLNVLGKTERLDHMISNLSKYRNGKGGWKGFPYFFTLFTLVEIDSPLATDELQYAYDQIETHFRRSRVEEPYATRRKEILTEIYSQFGGTLAFLVE
jgi:hypothetical protein